ncbi:MAG TPA: YihY/virulence factor BrkB family protein [Kofleriaceae bacterium]|nr:YihY/virulence factor BrkB family protein [Kofleriaceae bacterium]
MKARDVWHLVKQTFIEWNDDNASRLAAALAYYTIFSLAPLLVITIGLAGMVFGDDAVQGHVVTQLEGYIGSRGATFVQDMIVASRKPGHSLAATVIGVVVLLFGAAGVFRQLQDALNAIWEVTPRPGRGWRGLLLDRALAFVMVLGTGLMLLLSVGLSAAFATLGSYLSQLLPIPESALHALNFAVSFALITVLFAFIFKVVPDAVVAWRDVWIGAALTALLFAVGTLLIGLYLGKSGVTSTFGAAASLAILLVWIYYSAQILFLGAEFTQVYAGWRERQIRPARRAVAAPRKGREEPHQGEQGEAPRDGQS